MENRKQIPNLLFVLATLMFLETLLFNVLYARTTIPVARRQVPSENPEIRGKVTVVQLDSRNICLVGSYQDFLDERFQKECGPFLKALAQPEYRPQDWSYRFHYNFAAAEVVAAYRPLIARAYQAVDKIHILDSAGRSVRISGGGYWVNPVSAMHLSDVSTGEDQIVRAAEVLHFTFLELGKPLNEGETYIIRNALGESVRYTYSDQNRSDAIKVNQVGYAAEAGRKYGYLGCWRGPEQQGRDYSDWSGKRFSLIRFDNRPVNGSVNGSVNGQVVFQGTIEKRVVSRESEAYSGEQVWEMDFSSVTEPGDYILMIEGIGSSWPFRIGDDALGESFYVRMRGMYHKRCGCLKQEPYTAWTAEKGLEDAAKKGRRDWQNGAGASSGEKTGKLQEKKNGPVCHAVTYQGNFPPNWRHYGTRSDGGFYDEQGKKCEVKTFDLIHETCKPEKALSGVFGGWHDAADYDRRSLHLQSIGDLTAAYLMFPDNFSDGQLNIPESGNGIPDILDEAVWGALVWLRAQNAKGGVGCWIEADSHPGNYLPETDEQPYYLALPTMESTADYAGYASALALALDKAGAKELSKTFQQSAVRAYRFATDANNRLIVRYQNIPSIVDGKKDRRNIEYRESEQLSGGALGKAAFNLYLLTNDLQYVQDFKRFRSLGVDQYMKDLSWSGSPFYWAELGVWGCLEKGKSDDSEKLADFRAVFEKYQKQTIDLAQTRLKELNENYQYRMPWYEPGHAYVSHMSWGNFQPLNRARPFVVAWRLTGNAQYRDAALLCNDWQLGTNPTNSSMTSGLGMNYPVRFLDLPSYSDGIEEFVPGITPYRNTFGLSRPAIEMAWGLYYGERKDHDFIAESISILPAKLLEPGKETDINEYAKIVAGSIPVLRRFANVEGWSVAASEYTVWETIAPQAAITGCLLAPGWKPDAQLKGRRPVKDLRQLPGMYALP